MREGRPGAIMTRIRSGQGLAAGRPGAGPTGRARWAGGAARLDATSPLALGSHLVGLARDADQAGLTGLAEQLLALACAVLDHPPVAYA